MTDPYVYQRRIVCAANMNKKTGALILGARHFDMTMHNQINVFREAGYDNMEFSEQGFIDQRGQYMTRQEPWKVAEEVGQIIRRVGGDDAKGGTLYSENIY